MTGSYLALFTVDIKDENNPIIISRKYISHSGRVVTTDTDCEREMVLICLDSLEWRGQGGTGHINPTIGIPQDPTLVLDYNEYLWIKRV